MPIYISLLRGINVSGQKLMKMDALKKLYCSLGFEDVLTYVQSGNVIFRSENQSFKLLEELLSDKIKDEFGYEVYVFVMNVEQLHEIIKQNTLAYSAANDITSLYVTFLSQAFDIRGKRAVEIKKQESEDIVFGHKVVYIYCPDGYGRTKLTNKLIESKLNVIATTRNWKTVNALLELARKEL